ncbi:uncharacterized protein LOC134031281 [Osmerus eperlanus]|uniref:uncharacterized protein LOC134031281 n=1 Tax=Osmerus eperlanus TaxID=29151 RepID=UPI002E10E534
MENHTDDRTKVTSVTTSMAELVTALVSSTIDTSLYTNPASGTNTSFPTDFLDIIEANDITSRATYVYTIFMALALVSAVFLLYGFIQSYRAQRELALVDSVLLAFSVSQLLLLLLSLSSVAYRPKYLEATRLGCATLSFSVNTVFLWGMLLLVLMGYMLTFDATSHPLLGHSWVCVGLALLVSGLSSVLLAGLRWPSQGVEGTERCVIDAVEAGRSYIVAKLCVSFLIPYLLLLCLLVGGCVHQWKSSDRFLSGAEERSVFLAVSAATFACQVFYFAALLRGVGLEGLSHRERAFLSVAELVMYSESCVCLGLVLLLHGPSRESLVRAGRQLRDCCRSLRGGQTHSQVIAPHIEIGSQTSE